MQNKIETPYPWQQTQWDYLLKRWQQNNLPHALLFAGNIGLGKQALADLFARTIFCLEGKNLGAPCGACRSCLLLYAGSHPDYYSIQPEEAGKAIKIDQIRELIKDLSQTAQQSGYKIIILHPAEAMNTAASNALLKALEEPPGKTLFILICNQFSTLAATIRSRCQIMQFLPPNHTEAQQWLQPLLHNSQQDAELLLALAEQAPLQALALAQGEKVKLREQMLTCLKQLGSKNADPVQLASKWLKIAIKEILDILTSIITDSIRLSMGLPVTVLANKDMIEFLKQLAQTTPALKLFTYLDELYQWRQRLNNSASLNQQLVVENLFCKWNQLFLLK